MGETSLCICQIIFLVQYFAFSQLVSTFLLLLSSLSSILFPLCYIIFPNISVFKRNVCDAIYFLSTFWRELYDLEELIFLQKVYVKSRTDSYLG